MTERVIRKALRLEIYRGEHCVMNFSSPRDDVVIEMRDKIVGANTSGTLRVMLYEEVWTDRLLSDDEYGNSPVLVEDSDIFEDIGL